MYPRFSALLLVLLLAGCESTGAGASDPQLESAPDVAPQPAPEIEAEVWLQPADAAGFEFTSGLELGIEEPEGDIASRYEDGMSLFAYPLPRLGGKEGREMLVVMFNVRARQRLTLPSGRAQIVYMTEDRDSSRFPGEAGFIEIVNASEEGLWGRFEVRFDHLEQVIVHGVFDSRVAPDHSTVAPNR